MQGHKVRDPDLPSWVPDPSRLSPDKSYIPALYRKFAAAGSKRATIQELSQKEIVLKGVFIDIVSDIRFMPPRLSHGGVSCQQDAHNLYQYLLNMKSMAKSLTRQQQPEKSEDDEQSLSAVWGTAVMNVTRDAKSNTHKLEPNDDIVCSKARKLLQAYAHQPETSHVSTFLEMINEERVWAYCLNFTSVAQDFRFFVTEQQVQPRHMGMGPIEVLPNDRVVIFAGGRMSSILRPHVRSYTARDGAELPCCTLLGVAYVDAIMDGVTEKGSIDQDAEWEDIYLR
jgi:hypothetical protein